jgi:CLIP-associating protein 1/2
VDEESFIQAFEEVKKVNIFNGRELTSELNKIKETLTKTSNDWKVRIDALHTFRGLMIAGATQYDEFYLGLKTLEVAFQLSVKDLRSQVVREACITIAFISQSITQKSKIDRFLESLLQNVINLIPNSAKVMSTSGIVLVRFIIQNTHSPRFLPIICSNISCKSREIRRQCCEFLDQLLHTWPTHPLERHIGMYLFTFVYICLHLFT